MINTIYSIVKFINNLVFQNKNGTKGTSQILLIKRFLITKKNLLLSFLKLLFKDLELGKKGIKMSNFSTVRTFPVSKF